MCAEKFSDNAASLLIRLADDLSDVIYRRRIWPDEAFEYVSAAVERVTGYSSAELCADPELGPRIVHPDDLFRIKQLLETVDSAMLDYTVRWVCKDGSIRHMQHRDRVIRGGDGRVVAVEGVTRDVTAAIEAQAAMHRHQEMLDLASDSIFTWDAGSRLTSWNKRAERFYGWDESDVLGKNVHDLLNTRFPAPLDEIMLSILAVGRWEGQLVHTTRDGRQVTVESRWTLQDDADGKVVGYLEINHDITERVRLEAELLEREHRYRDLFDNSPDMYFLGVPTEHRVIDCNRTLMQTLGYTKEEIVGQPSSLLYDPTSFARMVEMTPLFQETHLIENFEVQLRRKDGSLIDALMSGRLEPDPAGGPLYARVTLRNITERKRAEEAHRDQEAQYRLLFENMTEGFSLQEVIVDDTGKVVDFRFLAANRAFTHHTGMDVDVAIGKTMLELVPTANRQQIEAYGHVAFTGEPLAYEYYSKTFDRHMRVRAYSPQRGQFVTIFEDITERKRAEAAQKVHFEIAKVLSSSDELDAGLAAVLNSMLHLEGIDSGGIYLADHDGALNLAAHRGLSPEFVSSAAHYDADTPHARLSREEKVRCGSYQDIFEEYEAVQLREGLQVLAVIPILYQGRLQAVLNVASHTSDAIPDSTITVLELVAGQIGSAIARLHAATAVRASQQNLRSLFDSMNDFLFVVDVTGRVVQVNDTVLTRLGYTADELIGEDLLITHPPARRAEAKAILDAMIAGEEDVCPVPLQTKGGVLIPAETRVTLGEWNGQPVIIGVSRDITARLEAEAVLKESEARFRLMADILPVPEVMTRISDGVILYANPAAVELSGMPSEQIIGCQTPLFNVETLRRASIFDEILQKGVVRRIEIEFRKWGQESAHWGLYSAASGTHYGEPVIFATMLDISERKQAELALAKLASIVDGTAVAIAGLDPDGNVVTWNHGAELLTGYNAADTIGQPISVLNQGSGLDTGQMVRRIKCGERVPPFETTRRTRDGREIDVIITLSPVCGTDGRLLGISSVAHDITARKRAEVALAESEARLCAIIENSENAIWSIDRDCHLLVANPAFQSIIQAQIGRSLAPGESVLDAPFSPETSAFWRPLYDRCLAGESFTFRMDSLYRADIARECFLNPIRDASGAVTGVAGRAVDISQRLKMEAEIHEALQRMKLATSAAEIGIWNWNLADGSLEWDDRMCEIYAVGSENRVAGMYYDLFRARVHPDDFAYAAPVQDDAGQVPSEWNGIFRIILPDSTIRHIQAASVMEFDRQGKPYRIIGVNRDVTQQVLYEQVLEQRVHERTVELNDALEELRTADRLKDEFLAAMSHELRTPLTGILGAANLLSMHLYGSLTERQQRQLATIEASGERLLNMVNDLLRYANLTAGRALPRRERCSLGDVGMCCISKVSRAETAKHLEVVYVIPDPVPVIISDAQYVVDLLDALLDNAIKFTPENGRIGLEISEGDNSVQLVVWDTGIGIAPEKLQSIFLPFVQGDGSLSRQYEGIGLGLAYAAKMTEALGGSIAAESEPGKGSRFTVILPAE